MEDLEDLEEYIESNDIDTEEIIYTGLILNDKYILLKKIGLGNNAGVWMVYCFVDKNFLAIKIQDWQCYEDGCREVKIIKKINEFSKKNTNVFCVNMLDFFIYKLNDDVQYVCTVYELYAGSIQMVLDEGIYKYGLPINIVKNIAKQLLQALNILHNNLKIVHTDIKPENILFKGMPKSHQKVIDLFNKSDFNMKYERVKDNPEKLQSLAMETVKEILLLEFEINNDEEFIPDDEDEEENEDYMSDEGNYSDDNLEVEVINQRRQSVDDVIDDDTELYDLEEIGEYDFVSVLNNRPVTTDKKQVIDEFSINNCQIALTDFGNSYFYDKRTKNEIQDRKYRAIEVILDINYGYAVDMWSFSCVIFELLTGFTLFDPETNILNKDIHHLYLIEKMLGPILPSMIKSSKRNKFLFDKNNHIKNVKKFQIISLEERLINQYLFSPENAKEIANFLKCGLVYNPQKRKTAKEMLKHPWLNN